MLQQNQRKPCLFYACSPIVHAMRNLRPCTHPFREPQRCVPPLHPYKKQLSPKGDAYYQRGKDGTACPHCPCHLFSDIRGSLPSQLCLSHAHKVGTVCTTSITSGGQNHSAHTDCITSTLVLQSNSEINLGNV